MVVLALWGTLCRIFRSREVQRRDISAMVFANVSYEKNMFLKFFTGEAIQRMLT